jgi:hypothetical protein
VKYKDVLHASDPDYPLMAKLRADGPDEMLQCTYDSRGPALRKIFEISQENDRQVAELKKIQPKFEHFYEAQWILGEAALEKRMKKLGFK